jgi:hypothetical protein
MVRGHLRDSHVECVSFGDLMKDRKHTLLCLCTLLLSYVSASDGCIKSMSDNEYEPICEKMWCDVGLLNEILIPTLKLNLQTKEQIFRLQLFKYFGKRIQTKNISTSKVSIITTYNSDRRWSLVDKPEAFCLPTSQQNQPLMYPL